MKTFGVGSAAQPVLGSREVLQGESGDMLPSRGQIIAAQEKLRHRGSDGIWRRIPSATKVSIVYLCLTALLPSLFRLTLLL